MACATCNKKKKKINLVVDIVVLKAMARPLYKLLSFIAKDKTAEASFFAFDELATRIVQRSCKAILNPLKLPVGLPRQLQDLTSKKFTFGISLTEDSFTSTARGQYFIDSIINRADRQGPSHKSTGDNLAHTLLQPQQTSPHTTTVSLQESKTNPASLSTPPPTTEPDQTPLKHSAIQRPPVATQSRRQLFGNKTTNERESTYEENLHSAKSPEDKTHNSPSSSSVHQKRKSPQSVEADDEPQEISSPTTLE